MGRTPVDGMHHHQLKVWRLPADFLQQLTPQRLLRRFARFEVPAKESPATGRDDRGTLVAELDQPAAIPLQHGQGDFNGHESASGGGSAASLGGDEGGPTGSQYKAAADGQDHQRLQEQQKNSNG